MIKKILLENFKAFDHAEIEIKPITILVGPNSGGKSSLLQPISLIQQTLGGGKEILGFKGNFLDLGDFDNVVHQNSKEKELKFRFDFDEEYLFCWDEIPGVLFRWDEIAKEDVIYFVHTGNDEYKLIKFLKDKYGLEWLDPLYLIIKKSEDLRTILIKGTFVWPPFPQNYILIHINDKNTVADLEISNDERTYEFDVGIDNNEKIIYTPDIYQLVNFLKINFRINWVRDAKIEKTEDNKIISVSTKENSLSLMLNDEKTILNLKIDDGRTDEFSVKIENGKLNIYDKCTYFDVKFKKDSRGGLFVKDFACDNGVFEYSLTDIREDAGYYKSKEFRINYERLAERRAGKKYIIPMEYFEPTFYRDNFIFFIRNWSEKSTSNINNPAQIIISDLAEMSKQLHQEIKTKFEKIRYIGPIRYSHDERVTYKISESSSQYVYVGRKGELAPNIIEANPELQKKIQKVMGDLKIANAVEILKLEKQKSFEFKIRTDITDKAVNFGDVGCGTSQLLPIIVQTLFQNLYSQDRSMVIIEQPEVHLHPKMQADFANIVVESIKSKKTKFLIETHSEYFIEGLRTNILKNPSLAEDLVIYYVEQNKNKKHSEITKIEIDSNGQHSSYLYSWDDIPGKDNESLIEFLNQKFDMDWIKTAKIEKIDDGRTIKVSTEKNYVFLKLNDEKTEVNLTIDDGRTDEFIAKRVNGKLKIYNSTLPKGYLINFRMEQIGEQTDLMLDRLKEEIGIKSKEKKLEIVKPQKINEVLKPEPAELKLEEPKPKPDVKVEVPKLEVKKKEKSYTYLWIALFLIIIFILLLYLIMTR